MKDDLKTRVKVRTDEGIVIGDRVKEFAGDFSVKSYGLHCRRQCMGNVAEAENNDNISIFDKVATVTEEKQLSQLHCSEKTLAGGI